MALAVFVSVGACTAGDPGGIPLEQLASRMAALDCRLLFECSDPFGDELESLLLRDQETCEREALRRVERVQAPLMQMVERGTLAYDPVMAEACLAEGSDGCRATLSRFAVPSACEAMFRGTVPDGEACWASAECTDGSFCTGGRCDATGVCAPKLAVGEACDGDGQCVGDAVCSSTDDPDERRCVEWPQEVQVLADAVEGEDCGQVTDTESLETYRACAPGLACEVDAEGRGVCAPTVPEGCSCSRSAECGDRLFCDCDGLALCTDDSGTCVRLTIVESEGRACDAEHVYCDEWNGLHCREGTCVTLGDGSEGSACGSHPDCDPGLICYGRECMRPRPAGAPCVDGDDRSCESYNCVDDVCAEPCDRR